MHGREVRRYIRTYIIHY